MIPAFALRLCTILAVHLLIALPLSSANAQERDWQVGDKVQVYVYEWIDAVVVASDATYVTVKYQSESRPCINETRPFSVRRSHNRVRAQPTGGNETPVSAETIRRYCDG